MSSLTLFNWLLSGVCFQGFLNKGDSGSAYREDVLPKKNVQPMGIEDMLAARVCFQQERSSKSSMD
jgi:hypothetical protein